MLFVVVAIGVEIYTLHCSITNTTPIYLIGDISNSYNPPSWSHFLGTDYLGRDVFYRAVAATSTAIKVGVIASSIAAIIGTTLGLIAGFFGGKFDTIVVWIYSTFAAMPTLLFILAFALLIKGNFLSGASGEVITLLSTILQTEPGMLAVYLAIGLTTWITLCRVVRAETLKLKNLPYIAAAKVCGLHPLYVMFKHILPNVFHLVIIYFTLTFASAIMSEVIVSYLGLGVQSAPSWGVMIADGQDRLWRGIWWEVAGATLFMFILVLSLNILGDQLRDKLDPKNS